MRTLISKYCRSKTYENTSLLLSITSNPSLSIVRWLISISWSTRRKNKLIRNSIGYWNRLWKGLPRISRRSMPNWIFYRNIFKAKKSSTSLILSKEIKLLGIWKNFVSMRICSGWSLWCQISSDWVVLWLRSKVCRCLGRNLRTGIKRFFWQKLTERSRLKKMGLSSAKFRTFWKKQRNKRW